MAIRRRNGEPAADVKLLLNKMNSTAQKIRLGSLLDGQKGCAKGKYSFAVQGGAVGSVDLLDEEGNAVKIPDNAIVTNAIIDVVTAPTSASTPTVAVSLVDAGDLKTATAIASFTGIIQGTPANTVGTAIKTDGEKTLTATIAGTTLTDGLFYVHLDYVVSEDF
jgi:hypothetical protein